MLYTFKDGSRISYTQTSILDLGRKVYLYSPTEY